jgi:hypothetical protein
MPEKKGRFMSQPKATPERTIFRANQLEPMEGTPVLLAQPVVLFRSKTGLFVRQAHLSKLFS